MKILMVCLGNICRSPVAEGVMKAKLAKYKIPGEVDSAGLLSFHIGSQPDKRAIASAKQNNIDISGQRARQFNKSDFNNFDYIFTLDDAIHKDVLNMASNNLEKEKVHLLLTFSGNEVDREVPDPYCGGKEDFIRAFELIEIACDKIAAKFQRELK